MNILIADDEIEFLKILSSYFRKEGFSVLEALDGEEAIEKLQNNKVDLAILDWMMPKLSGDKVCRYIKENMLCKVLMLTAKSSNEDEIIALNFGADEYVKKPFDTRILILRAKKLLNLNNDILLKDIRISLLNNKVYKMDNDLNLTKIEFDLLKIFVNNKGIVLSRDKLIDMVWGYDYDGDYRTVDTHIRRLRMKIGEKFIKTYRGIGYSLEVEKD